MNYLVKKLNKKDRGFTLIELIVVIGILAILAVIAIPAIAGYLQSAKEKTNVSNAKIIYNACEAYLASNPTIGAETLDNDLSVLTTGNYISAIPKTVGGGDFTVTGTNPTTISITWTADGDETPTYP